MGGRERCGVAHTAGDTSRGGMGMVVVMAWRGGRGVALACSQCSTALRLQPMYYVRYLLRYYGRLLCSFSEERAVSLPFTM